MNDREPLAHNKKVRSYLRYSGIGFQLIGLMTIGYFLGQYFDKKAENETSYYTAGLILFLLCIYLIRLVRSLINDKSKWQKQLKIRDRSSKSHTWDNFPAYIYLYIIPFKRNSMLVQFTKSNIWFNCWISILVQSTEFCFRCLLSKIQQWKIFHIHIFYHCC